MTRLASELRKCVEVLSALITLEMGKPIRESRAEVLKCANCAEWFAERGPAMLADEPVTVEGSRVYVSYLPSGTVLGIMPWNFPLWQVIRAAVPILLAGNAFLLKPAPNVMGCAYALREIFDSIGAPRGLFGVLHIQPERVEAVLAADGVTGVTLTGSVRAGSAVAAMAGKLIKKSVLELGGSDAFVVLADADVARAVAAAVTSRFSNAGQVCIAAKRFLLHRSIADRLTAMFLQQTKALKVGDPLEDATQIGPLAREDLRDALHRQVQATIAQGASLLLGGKPMERPGWFYEPTVLQGVQPGMPAFDEETFGPVAALTIFDDESEAMALANHSSYGLSLNLWTRDTDRAAALARDAQVGAVFVNGFAASDPRVPIGGVKNSGYGRELSHFGIREFTNAQTVWIRS